MSVVKTHRNIGIGLGLYFNCFVWIGVLDLPKLPGYLLATGIGLSTVAYGLFVHDFHVRRSALIRWLFVTGLFAAILSASYATNFDDYQFSLTVKAIGYVSLFMMSSLGALVGGRRSARACLLTYWLGLLAAVALTMAVNNVNSYNGRLHGPFGNPLVTTSGLHANEIGLLGMTAVLVSAATGWPGILLTVPIGLYVAYLSSCRGAMMGIVLAVLVLLVCREFLARSQHRSIDAVPLHGLKIFAGLIVMAGIVGVVAGPFIVDKVLMVSDARRGLTSGFTGRWDQWRELVGHWLESPVLGRGYSIVRNDALSVGGQADGGFLLVMAELGLLGLLYFLTLFACSMKACVGNIVQTGSSSAIVFFVFLITFFFINLFESRIVGTGSTGLGMFFYISALCVVHAPTERMAGKVIPVRSAVCEMSIRPRSV